MARYLSIDADSHGLLVAVGSASRDKISVERLIAATDIAQPLTVANAAMVGERLKQLLKEAKVAPAPALVAIGRDRIIVKEVKHPPVPPADEPNVIRFQALKEVAEGADDVIFDYLPLASSLNAAEKRAAVAFVKKDVVAAVRTMCDAAGLKLAAITPRPFGSVAAMLHAAAIGSVPPPEPADGPVAIIVVHDGGGEFTVCRNGAVTFTRPISPAAVAWEELLLTEIRRNLTVAASQAGCEVQAVYVSEAETRGEGWSGRLRVALGLPLYTFDPLEGLSEAGSIPAELHGRFLGAVGLLRVRGRESVLPINFVQPRQPRRNAAAASSPKRQRALVAAMIGMLLVGSLAIGGFLYANHTESKVTSLQRQIALVDKDIEDRTVDAKRVDGVNEFLARNVNWLDEYYEQMTRFPDIKKEPIRIQDWTAQAAPMPTEKERQDRIKKGKNAPPEKIANLQITLAAPNNKLPSDLHDGLMREKRFYIDPKLKSGASLKTTQLQLQQYVLSTDLAQRISNEYRNLLRDLFIPRAAPPDAPKTGESAKAETPPVAVPIDDPPEEDAP